MRFHTIVLSYYGVEGGPDIDPHLMAYLTALARWEFSSLTPFFEQVASRYPIIAHEHTKHKDHPSIKGIAVLHDQGRSYALLVLQSELFDRDPTMVMQLIPWQTVSEDYHEQVLRMDQKLRARI